MISTELQSFVEIGEITQEDAVLAENNLEVVGRELREDLIADIKRGDLSCAQLASRAFIQGEMDDDEVAHHEAAHYVLGNGISATIVPSGGARGVTHLNLGPIRSLYDIEYAMEACFAGGMGAKMRGRGTRGCGSDHGKARWLAKLHSRISRRPVESIETQAEISAASRVASKAHEITSVAHRLRRRKTI